MKLLVAGGAGFIGSNYVRLRLGGNPDDSVRVLDKLTYAGRPENLEGLSEERFELIEADIADRDAARAAVEACDAVVNSPGASIERSTWDSAAKLTTASTVRSRRPASSSP